LDALAQYLGEAPSEAALRRPGSSASSCARPGVPYRPSKAPSTRGGQDDDSSDEESDGMPCDGGFDDQCDYDSRAPYSAPAPRRLREFDEPQVFDCERNHVPVAAVAAKRSSGRSGSGKGAPLPARGDADGAAPEFAAPRKSRPPKGLKSAAGLGATATPEPGTFAEFLGHEDSPMAAEAAHAAERKSRRQVPRAAAEIDLGGQPPRASSRQRDGDNSGRRRGGYEQPSPSGKSGSPNTGLEDPLGMSGRRRFGGRA